MKNNINIAELLKDCPKGTKLYSPLFGEVEFDCIEDGIGIKVDVSNGCTEIFCSNGRFYNGFTDAECLLFPSKDQRDWSKLQRPFKDGDILISGEGKPFIFKQINSFGNAECYCAINCYGELIFNSDNWTHIKGCRLATPKEKEKLFDAIKASGYHWNEETKTFKELTPKKFDITTLKPFDKVLMRSSNAREWVATFYSHYSNNKFYGCGMCCDQCIPYEGNQHLLGTTNDCDEYYKTWE